MLAGIKTPTSKDEKKNIFLLTFFGNPTTSISEGLTMVLNLHWFDIVEVIEIEVVNFEDTVDVPQEIRCSDDVTIGGKVTIGFIVDLKGDKERTAGEKVLSYVKAGQKKGVMDIIKGSVIQSLKVIAAGKDSKYMETNPDGITKDIMKILEKGIPKNSDSEDTVTLSDLGVDVRKLSISLVAPQAIRDARNGKAIEEAQRTTQLADAETMNQRVRERIRAMGITFDTDGKPIGDIRLITGMSFVELFAKVRAQLIEETTLNDGRLQIIRNSGGVTVVDADTSGKGSKKGEPAYVDVICRQEGESRYSFCWAGETGSPVEPVLRDFDPSSGQLRIEFYEKDRIVGDICLEYDQNDDVLRVIKRIVDETS
jgi:hypothetical protein